MNNFETEVGEFGQRLIVRGNWSEQHAQFMAEHDIKELTINGADGFTGTSLDFLAGIPQLEGLNVLVAPNISLRPILAIGNLRSLTNSSARGDSLDLTRLVNLERLSVMWYEGIASLFQCRNIQKLYINGLIDSTLDRFRDMTSISSLRLVSRTMTSIQGLEHLTQLREFRISRSSRLCSLEGIQSLTGLQELMIYTCRCITSLELLGGLSELKYLDFSNCGDINSLIPIAGLQHLEHLSFTESTNIKDGDLSVILSMPNLKKVLFQDRKHYSHRRDLFPPWNSMATA